MKRAALAGSTDGAVTPWSGTREVPQVKLRDK